MAHPHSLMEFSVEENRMIAQDVWQITIVCPKLAQSIEPGQFAEVKVPGDKTQLLRVPLSFSGVDAEKGTVEIIYQVVGDATRRMTEWKSGFVSNLIGPLGNGWHELQPEGRVLLVCGGVGVTPILGLARYFAAHGVSYDVVLAARCKDCIAAHQNFVDAGAHEILITTDDGSLGLKGFAHEGMAQLVENNDYSRIYACGPTLMMKAVALLAQEHDIACEVSLERMMTCGFAACGTCNVAMVAGGYKACCKEGPVFDGCEVAW